MRRVFARIRLLAPALKSERGSLALGAMQARAGGGATEPGEEALQEGLDLRGGLEDRDLAGKRLSGCRGEGGRFLRLRMGGTTWSRGGFSGAAFEGGEAAGATFELLDLGGARIAGLAAPGARFSLCNLRGAELRDCDLGGATFLLCDLSGARLEGLDLRSARFVGCEIEDADLLRLQLEGAEFGGSSLLGSVLEEGSGTFSVADADLRGALGFGAPAELRARGARAGGGRVLGLWLKVLKAGDAPGRARARRATAATWAALAVAIPAAFFGRAILHPIDPDAPPQPGFELPAQELEPPPEAPPPEEDAAPEVGGEEERGG